MKIIPNARGEKAVLKLMFSALIRTAENCRPIGITGFERRRMQAIGDELDTEYGTNTGPLSGEARNTRPPKSPCFGLDQHVALRSCL